VRMSRGAVARRRSTRKYSCSGPMLVKTRLTGCCRPAQNAQGLLAQGLLRAQHRILWSRPRRCTRRRRWGWSGLPVGLDLQEDRARDIPGGVAAGLEGGADAARGEGACVGLPEQACPRTRDGLAVTGGLRKESCFSALGRSSATNMCVVAGAMGQSTPSRLGNSMAMAGSKVRGPSWCGRSFLKTAWPGTGGGRLHGTRNRVDVSQACSIVSGEEPCDWRSPRWPS